jgi:hypothetical protein
MALHGNRTPGSDMDDLWRDGLAGMTLEDGCQVCANVGI